MIRALLVEDDAPIRRGIFRHVKWESIGIQEVKVAANSEEALALRESFAPDIVISDIRLPGMDGIDLCRLFEQSNPETLFIFISGYSDKEYLTAAIDLGVIAYIEKPIDLKVLEGALVKAVARHNMLREWHENNLHSLLYSAEAPSYQSREDRNAMIILIFSRDPVLDIHKLAARLAEKINPPLSNDYEALGDRRSDNYSAILVSRTRTWTDSVAERVRNTVLSLRDPDEEWFVTSGRNIRKKEDTVQSYNDAKEAVQTLSFKGWNSSASYKESFTEWHGSISPDDERRLYFFLQHRDSENAIAFVDEWYRTLVDEEAVINFDVQNLFYTMNRIVSMLDPEGMNAQEDSFPQGCYTLDELRDYVVGHIERTMWIGAGTGEGSVITRVCLYIEENIGNASLSVSEIAEYVGLSPAYLSTVFKNKMNTTLIQYISAARIKRAVALLGDPSVRFNDIAGLCGYNDRKYFSRVFKKQMGMSPADYRDSMKKQ